MQQTKNRILLPLFLSLILQASCATLVSRTELIAIDSTPRGIEVYEKGETLGQTPFVYERQRSSKLVLFTEGDKGKKGHRSHCSYRWKEAGLANLIFLYGAILAIPLDLWTGAAYSCPELITLLGAGERETANLCRHYIFLPPLADSSLLSGEIESLGKSILQKQLQPCDKIIDINKSDHLFHHLGISYRNTKRRYPQKIYNYLMADTGANILVDAHKEDLSHDEIYVRLNKLDMYNGEETQDSVTLSKKSLKYSGQASHRWVIWLEKFIPNTVSLGISATDPSFGAREGYELVGSRRKGLPYFVDLASLNHPSALETWDTDYDFNIRYPFFFEKYVVNTRDINTLQSYLDHWTLYRVGVNFQLEGVLHTPIGAFTLGIGLAPTYLYTRSSDSLLQNKIGILPTLSFTYRAFISEDIYFLTESYLQVEETVSDEHVTRQDLVRTSVGFGYLLPFPIHRFFLHE